MLLLQTSLLIVTSCFISVQGVVDNVQMLTNIFFENLRGDPNLQYIGSSTAGKEYVDKQINSYVNFITKTELESIRRKRSLFDKITKDSIGSHLLREITPLIAIPAKFPVDITIFKQNSKWYAATLESSDVKTNADSFVIYKYTNETFIEQARRPVMNGIKIATVNLNDSTLITVAENDTYKHNFHEKSGIYLYSANGLGKVQSIDMNYASDIAMWKIHDEIYLSTAQIMSNESGIVHYDLEFPIYKWLGRHFDFVQSVKSKGARRITPFAMDHAHFLAIANSRNDAGETKVYSEIYKYNYHLDKYALYQRILTKACADIKVFSLNQNVHNKDYFMVVANSYDQDGDGNINYDTNSIIYKFVNDYFIPFQSIQITAVEQWLPVQFDLELGLFASCRFDGVRYFQYDGWLFREVPLKVGELFRGIGVRSLRYVNFNNTPALVVSNKNNNGKIANVFRLDFQRYNTFSDIYNELIAWCDKGLEKVDMLSSGELFDALLGKAERADIDESDEPQFNEINSHIDSLNSLLQQLEAQQVDGISADVIIFKNSTMIHNLNVTMINNVQADELIAHHLDLEKGFEMNELKLTDVKLEGPVMPKKINGRGISTLLHRTDNVTLNLLTSRGNISAPNGLQIDGRINEVKVDDHNLLLKVGDQTLLEPLNLTEVKIVKLIAKCVNGAKLVYVQQMDDQVGNVNYIRNLKVKNITIRGFINEVDVPTLEKYALKQFGNQEITADYIFDVLEGINLEIDGTLSGRKLSDLIPTNSGHYSINQDLIFKNNVTVHQLEVSDFLNGIGINNGKIDILLKDHTDEQEISGEKMFDDLVIYNAIYLQGNIKSKELEKMNPVITIQKHLVLNGNWTITGEVLVENDVDTQDLATPSGRYSLTRLQTDGLQLTEKEIIPRLHFVQQLNVNEIFVDTINGRNPGNFVVTGSNQPQIVEGSKLFTGDLQITGTTNALKINHVDIEELENNVMKIEGNQIISGKHHVKHVVVNRILSFNTRFGTESLNNIPTTVVVNGDLITNSINVEALTVKGQVNDFNFDEVVSDTVIHGSQRIIDGWKFFNNLTIDTLNVVKGVAVGKWFEQANEVKWMGPLELTQPVEIENLYFENKCNGMDRNSFGQKKIDDNGSTLVDGDQNFDTIIVYGDTFIASNKINDVDITNLTENTVKIDEPFEFKTASFECVVSSSPVLLGGNIENVDLDNVVLSNTNLEQDVVDEKTFYNNVTIHGTITLFGTINGLNLTNFCQFAMGNVETKNLIVDGGAYFAKGPSTVRINNVQVDSIRDKAWFDDVPTVLNGNIEFSEIVLKNDVVVEGLVENISLNSLKDNYFSKSKDQYISANFTFENEMIFENNVTFSRLTLDGEINGVNLEELLRTVLLDDYDQVFETTPYLENCIVGNLTGDFTVNNLDLARDVMRYDKVNMITGTKYFQNLTVHSLKLDKNIKIQEVDVLDWFKNSVLKTTTLNITGAKSFKSALFAKGFQLFGTLNGIQFDESNVMVKNIPQEIFGQKSILTNVFDPVTFKNIKFKGLLNGVDLSNLVNYQAYKNKDNTFQTSLSLQNNIITHNLEINKTYRGINMSDLIRNVTKLGALNNLLEQYNNALVMSDKLEKSIKEQAYFMHHFKVVQTISGMTNSRIIIGPDGIARVGILIPDNSTVRMDLLDWHEERQFFKDGSIPFTEPMKYIDQVFMDSYLYWEGNEARGKFVHMADQWNIILDIPTNETKSTTSFIMPSAGECCTLFLYHNCNPKIYCEHEGRIRLMQTLDILNAETASSITIKDTVYLIIINISPDRINCHTDLWKLNSVTHSFEMHQSMFEAEPKSVAAIRYGNFYYLAIASGHLQNAMYSGRVELRKFEQETEQFLPWQSLQLSAPTKVKFAILPSNELVLYVLTSDSSQSLLIFRYEGIAGFKLQVVGSTLPTILYTNLFTAPTNQHFVVAQSAEEINVIEVIFKGEKLGGG